MTKCLTKAAQDRKVLVWSWSEGTALHVGKASGGCEAVSHTVPSVGRTKPIPGLSSTVSFVIQNLVPAMGPPTVEVALSISVNLI